MPSNVSESAKFGVIARLYHPDGWGKSTPLRCRKAIAGFRQVQAPACLFVTLKWVWGATAQPPDDGSGGCLGQGLIQIGDQIVNAFNADRQADNIRAGTCGFLLFRR